MPHDQDRTTLTFPAFILNDACESLLSVSPGVDKAVERQHDGTPNRDHPVRRGRTSQSWSVQCPGRHRSGCDHGKYQPCRSGVRRARRRQHQMALRPRGALQLRRAGPGQDVHDSHDPSHRCRRHPRPRRRIGLCQGHRRAGTRPDQCRRHPGLGTPHAHRGHGRHLLGGLENPDAARNPRARQPDHGVTITIAVGSVTRVSPARSARHR